MKCDRGKNEESYGDCRWRLADRIDKKSKTNGQLCDLFEFV